MSSLKTLMLRPKWYPPTTMKQSPCQSLYIISDLSYSLTYFSVTMEDTSKIMHNVHSKSRTVWFPALCGNVNITDAFFVSMVYTEWWRHNIVSVHDDVIKWKHFPRYWPFVRGIHRWPVNSPHKGQWRGALMVSLICAWINGWVNYREAGDLRRHRAHYDVTVMAPKY